MIGYFKKTVYEFLGSDKVFILLLAILGTLITAIIFTHRKEPTKLDTKELQKTDSKENQQGPTVTYKGNSTHHGDNRF